jgi:hypothetical protein
VRRLDDVIIGWLNISDGSVKFSTQMPAAVDRKSLRGSAYPDVQHGALFAFHDQKGKMRLKTRIFS